jgi:hypothetical protein
VNFCEHILDKEVDKITIGSIVEKYIEVLPHVNYKVVSIIPKGDYSFKRSDLNEKYIVDVIIADGPWKKIGDDIPRINVKFQYKIEDCVLNLEVFLARIEENSNSTKPVLAFFANFSHRVRGDSINEKRLSLKQAIRQYKKDIQLFEEIISKSFLYPNVEEQVKI